MEEHFADIVHEALSGCFLRYRMWDVRKYILGSYMPKHHCLWSNLGGTSLCVSNSLS